MVEALAQQIAISVDDRTNTVVVAGKEEAVQKPPVAVETAAVAATPLTEGIEVTGSLEKGKNGDLVIWNGNPFSVYTRAEKVYVDGALVYDLNDPAYQAVSDFTLGSLEIEGGLK